MSPPAAPYLTRLIHLFWSFFLSIFSSRRKHPSSPELPTFVANHENECDVSGGLASWQQDKQQFLRRPSLVRATSTRARETREKKQQCTMSPPPPEIYIEDWSSLGLNMADLFETPSSRAGGAVGSVASTNCLGRLASVPENSTEPLAEDNSPSPTSPPMAQANASSEPPSTASIASSEDLAISTPEPPGSQSSEDVKTVLVDALTSPTDTPHSDIKTELSIDLEQDAEEVALVPEPATLSFSDGLYASNALSAVSGLLWDPPSFSISQSTPLPDVAPFLPKRGTLTLGRDSLPYPDLFDFSMYARRISRDSFCAGIELPSMMDMSIEEPSEKARPVSIYDVVNERDRYRGAAYSACVSAVSVTPKRRPFSSAINLDSRRNSVRALGEKSNGDESLDIGAQFMEVCDTLSRCEWTEEEFLEMLASSGTV
ncbi:hypothetical protein DFH06DRAFT_1119782 [Mycena polygramma]|nr:hypothetical protein DFH06DRAFT_1119782 [Mycena polygramma]